MSYLALYRKYRPQTFADVCGQTHIIKILEQAISQNKISHAYLFSGPRGTGKTTVAKLIAKIVNCENRNGLDCCDKCSNCLSYNEKTHPDVIEIDAASNNGVDEIRQIRENVSLMPVIGKYKVYIIDEVHMLSIGAFNALLKTLEDPPSHVIFILATTEFYKVPETIVSRCQCFEFSRIEKQDIVSRLSVIAKSEKVNEVLELIAKYCDGGLRDAVSMLDMLVSSSDNITVSLFYDLKGVISDEEYSIILDDVISFSVKKLIDKLDELSDRGKNFIFVADGFLEYVKNVIVNSFKENYFVYDIDVLYTVLNGLNDIVLDLKKSSFPRTVFEVGLLKIAHDCNGSSGKNIVNDFAINLEKSIVKEEKVIEEKTVEQIKPSKIYDKSIRINNAFCLANKDLLNRLKEGWNNFSSYLGDPNYSSIVSYLADGVIRVAGDKDVVISLKYSSLVCNADLYVNKLEKLFEAVFNSFYHIAFISDDEWEDYRKKYISDRKKGVVYNYVEEQKKDDIINNVVSDESISDNVKDAIDLFGNDVVSVD